MAEHTTTLLDKDAIDSILTDQHKRYLYGEFLPGNIDPGKDAEKRAKLCVFSLASANIPFHKAVQAWQLIMSRWGEWRSPTEIVDALKQKKCCTVNIASAGKEGIMILQDKLKNDPAFFFKASNETHTDWAKRIKDTVPGLGYVKATFAVCLMEPFDADIGCPDRHMLRVLVNDWTSRTGKSLDDYLSQTNGSSSTLPESACKKAISELQRLAKEYGWKVFPLQWALWDSARGNVEDHSALAAIHTC